MAPNAQSALSVTGVLFEEDNAEKIESEKQEEGVPGNDTFKTEIVWSNSILLGLLQIAAIYGLYLSFTSAQLVTVLFSAFCAVLFTIGITGGAHRLWAHRAYKAKLPLKLFLLALDTAAYQNSVIEWVRDHRVHHKYAETDADPHNRKRGFFFSHMGWLMCKKHPAVKKYGAGIDISDLTSDPILAFQHKYYLFLLPIFSALIPMAVPVYCWDETWKNSFFVVFVFRLVVSLHLTWFINSAAHTFGNRPYDKSIMAHESFWIAPWSLGEAWHNYHHVFPWDYKAAELGNYRMNWTTGFLDFMGKIGWAYDFKTVPPSMVKARVERTGDGTHPVWGWGDKDMLKEEVENATVLFKKDK